jgi:hypothetical protein
LSSVIADLDTAEADRRLVDRVAGLRAIIAERLFSGMESAEGIAAVVGLVIGQLEGEQPERVAAALRLVLAQTRDLTSGLCELDAYFRLAGANRGGAGTAMNPHARDSSASPEERLAAVIWELRKGSRIARCDPWRHPLGWEVRCDVDGETRQTAVLRVRETAVDRAADWQRAFEAKGWE